MEEEKDYDILNANGVFDEIKSILNRDMCDIKEAMEYENGINKSVNNFLTNLFQLIEKFEKKVPNQKKIDKIINDFKVISNGTTNK